MLKLESALEVLRSGGVVMHPTETCYGLAVDIFNENAVKKLYDLKGRPEDNPVSILVDSLEMALEYGFFSPKALDIASKYWPGPLSLVVPRTSLLPAFLNPGQEFVSIRFSSDAFAAQIVGGLGGPVTTTSANLSGRPPLYEADLSQFGEKASLIGLVIDGGKIDLKPPSTIVKIAGDDLVVLRKGEIEIV